MSDTEPRRPRLFASGEREDAPPAPAAPAGEPADEQPADGPEDPEVSARDDRLSRIRRAGRWSELRKRRFWVIAIIVGAAVVVFGLCAGGLAVISAVHSARGGASDAREARRLSEADCLELESRLNHLSPPGATTTPAARAVAVQDENSAVRIYVSRLGAQRNADAWRQLLDARTSYAEALGVQAKSRTPAFYVAPRTVDGQSLTDQLVGGSPASCSGPIRRLASPDL